MPDHGDKRGSCGCLRRSARLLFDAFILFFLDEAGVVGAVLRGLRPDVPHDHLAIGRNSLRWAPVTAALLAYAAAGYRKGGRPAY